MNEKLVMSVVLGLLIVVSAVQAFQLNDLKDTLSEDGFSTQTTTTKAPASAKSSGGSGSLPASIKDLPSMVGGC